MSKYPYTRATLSTCGTYRYDLERGWGLGTNETTPYVLWVLLNPSTADVFRDDPTVRKAATFTALACFQRMVFVNLYAYRSTNPRILRLVQGRDNIVGPDNDMHIQRWAEHAGRVIVAWGSNPIFGSQRHHDVLALLRAANKKLECLGVNQNKHPAHPLMLSYATPIIEYYRT